MKIIISFCINGLKVNMCRGAVDRRNWFYGTDSWL